MDGLAGGGDPSPVAAWQHKVSVTLQRLRDRSTPHIGPRWAVLGLVVLLYTLRVWFLQGFYIVTYALAIYNLNLLLGFLTPQIDPESEGPELPTKSDQEFRPFVRRLPEFKFWWSALKSVLIGFLVTFFRVFDVPVFWPILLLYWFILFFLTMKRQIRHMIKYKYLPFSFGKKKYTGRPGERRLDKDSKDGAPDDPSIATVVTSTAHAAIATGQYPPVPAAGAGSYAPPAAAAVVTERNVGGGAPGAFAPHAPQQAYPAYPAASPLPGGYSFPAASPLNAGGVTSPPQSHAPYGAPGHTSRPTSSVNQNYI